MKLLTLRDWRRAERGFLSLIALLAAIVIIGILAAIMFKGGPSRQRKETERLLKESGAMERPGGPTTVYGKAMERARVVAGENNLQQARMAIQLFQGSYGRYPSSLQELQQSNPGLKLTDSITKQPFNYDPSTGTITSPGASPSVNRRGSPLGRLGY